MNAALRVSTAAVVAGAGIAAMIGLSQVPWRPDAPESGVLRLTWRSRGLVIRECRPLTAEEQRNVPQHMRQPGGETCHNRSLPFRLRVSLDGRLMLDRPVLPAGARSDRPLYVFEDLALDPGRHSLEVDFEALPDSTVSDTTEITIANLYFRDSLVVPPRTIVLLTTGNDERSLGIRGGASD